MTGNATNYENKQGDNPICSTRDEFRILPSQFHHERPLRGRIMLWILVRTYSKSFIFTGVQRVKTALFYKSNSVRFINRVAYLWCHGTPNSVATGLMVVVIPIICFYAPSTSLCWKSLRKFVYCLVNILLLELQSLGRRGIAFAMHHKWDVPYTVVGSRLGARGKTKKGGPLMTSSYLAIRHNNFWFA